MELLQVNIKNAGYLSNKEAIEDIVFNLEKGELVGLIGPNGAGKSTTIKALLGLLPVINGEIIFKGDNKNFAYIPEQPILYDGLTLWEHLELAASAYQLPSEEFLAKTENLLQLFRLQEVRHHIPSTFSKGMQQKVMLIIGFLIEADVYVVDEPFVGLDPRAIKDFMNLLNEARKRGAGVIMSTHVLDTAEKICDTFVLMDNGTIAAQGNLNQIREQCQLPDASLFDCFDMVLEKSI